MRNKLTKWLAVAVLTAVGAFNGATQAQTTPQPPPVVGWDFNDSGTISDGDDLRSAAGNYTGLLVGDAQLVDDGRPNGGGRALDVSEANPGHVLLEAEGDDNPMNLAAADDQVTVVIWQKNFSNVNSSSFWAVSESSDRFWQFHVPWSNGNIYFDTMGCCT
jgi:hypothetical protein